MSEKTYHNSLNYIQKKIKDILSKLSADEINTIKQLFLQADRIFVYGAGRSGLAAKAFAIRLVHLGFQTFVIGETITAPVTKDDLVVVVSGSGETIPAVMTAEIANNIGANIIAITSNKESRLANHASVPLILSADCKDKERKQLAPLGTLFEASAWIFLDSLVAELMEAKGENEGKMRARHATLEQ